MGGSRDHGDARQAVALLARSAYLAEKAGSKIAVQLVDEAASAIEQDRYLTMIRTAPPQLQATMAAVFDAARKSTHQPLGTGEAYNAYRIFCDRVRLRPLTCRAFSDLLAELDTYSLLHTRVLSRGRYGRTREIVLDLPEDILAKMQAAINTNFDLAR